MGHGSFPTEQEQTREEALAIVQKVLGQSYPTTFAIGEATRLAEQFGFETELNALRYPETARFPGYDVDENRRVVRRLKKDGVGPGTRAHYGDIEVEVTGFTRSKVWIKHLTPPRRQYKVDPHALRIEQS